MNKKGQQNDIGGKVLLIVVCFLLIGIILYFLANIAIWIGLAGIVISLIIMGIAGNENDEEGIKVGVIILIVSIILVIGGFSITHFFESNEIGESWLSGGKTIINTTAEIYKSTKEIG